MLHTHIYICATDYCKLDYTGGGYCSSGHKRQLYGYWLVYSVLSDMSNGGFGHDWRMFPGAYIDMS